MGLAFGCFRTATYELKLTGLDVCRPDDLCEGSSRRRRRRRRRRRFSCLSEASHVNTDYTYQSRWGWKLILFTPFREP